VNERSVSIDGAGKGRAGKRYAGTVMIRVATKHPVLHMQQHDYKLFYKNEIREAEIFFILLFHII
jgi:hypothetical protein